MRNLNLLISPRSRQRLLLALFLFVFAGCRDKPDISWSARISSPDKHWLLIVHGEAGGSFGGGYAQTTVSLNQQGQPPLEILGFDRLVDKSDLHFQWTDSKHLDVTIQRGTASISESEVIFQAIKCADVTITFNHSPNQSQ